jgi:SAM-dependent methyltransferase
MNNSKHDDWGRNVASLKKIIQMRSRLPLSTVLSYFIESRRIGVEGHVLQFENLLTMLQYRKAYEVTLSHLRQGMKVLDWGCGNGHFSYFLSRQKIDTTGYSFDTAPIFLEHEPLFHFAQGDSHEPATLPFADSTFDIVFSIGVLEHVYETGGSEERSLQEIRRVLKSEGRFLCFHFPNRFQWVEPLGRFLGLAEHFHHRKYTYRNIQQLAGKNGFEIEEIGRYNFYPRNQLRVLPIWFKQNIFVIHLFEFVDGLFSRLLPWFCTNFYFVARVKE